MIRIAHVTSGLDRSAAGVGVVVSRMSREQQSRGYEVRVFGPESCQWIQRDKDIWEGAPAEAYPVYGRPRSFGYSPELAASLTTFEPDIVHVHGLWMYPNLAICNWHRATHKPYVVSPHGMLAPAALKFSAWKKRTAWRIFQSASLANAAAIHATSETEMQDIRTAGLPNETVVIPLGVDETPVPVSPPEPIKRVLSLGRMHPQKGLDRLINAWSQLEATHPEWALDLVGPDENNHKRELEALATKLGIKRVTIRPAVFDLEKDVCLSSARLFVLPSRGENFALTVAESLMMKTPVISTHGAPWSGLARENCGWWIEHGVEPLVKTLEEAMHLTDGELMAFGERGRAWMLRDYSWGAVADKTLQLYRDVIAKFS
ncbi:glycosyltransferase [Parafrankia sp. BMG5.11]|uniref:glycosyltransferase n=1 Tax=Parafrankia sp. BMG5.11 TaxID=222540 RepID=UPI00103E8E11|nr:glycosyltransferase [Parafrankia sp. BMG5.11]TCJ39572.1 glycosyltransferase [Parafrankia sp. BMG5.11]